MKKLKWTYNRRAETHHANDGEYLICKNGNRSYELVIYENKYTMHDIPFTRLSSAKKVAQLIHNG